MHRRLSAGLLAMAAIVAAAATGGAQDAPLRMGGVVEVPAMLNRYAPDGTPAPAAPIQLRAQPALGTPVVATVTEPGQLETKEYDYEENAAIAYDRRGEWTLVKTSKGVAGWLAPGDAGEYHSLEALLQQHRELADLTDAWDGSISRSPGSAARQRVPVDPGRAVIGFLEPTLADASLHPIFERADRRSRVIAQATIGNPERTLRTTGSVPYEIVVLERRPGWFRVALAEQRPGEIEPAWVPESPVWRFHELAGEEERRELGRRAWGHDLPDVRVVRTLRIGEVLWVEIEVLNHSFCLGKTPVVRQRGWIPAHAPSGELNIWYPPRGC